MLQPHRMTYLSILSIKTPAHTIASVPIFEGVFKAYPPQHWYFDMDIRFQNRHREKGFSATI